MYGKRLIGLFSGDNTSTGRKARTFQRADIAIEKKRMLAAVEVMQRMRVEKCLQISLPADHMLARGNENSAGTKHAEHFAHATIEIAGVVQHGSRKHDVERSVGKRQALGKFLDHFDRQRGLRGQRPDRCGADEGAGIRLERGHRKSFAGERIACDAASGADVERLARPAPQ